MLRSLLVNLGLAKAPAPIRSYVTASSFFGVLPAVAFVGWKYRSQIADFARRLNARRHRVAAAPAE